MDADFEVVGELCLEHGARDVLVARDRRTRDRLWEARRMIIEALNHESPINHMEDVVVPRAEIPALLKGIKEIGRAARRADHLLWPRRRRQRARQRAQGRHPRRAMGGAGARR